MNKTEKKAVVSLLALGAINQGGATIDQQGNHIKIGIAVAVSPLNEHKCDYKSYKYLVPEITLWLDQVAVYIPESHSFGCWADDDGIIWLDVVEVLPADQIILAVLKAKQRKQKAIQLLHPCTTLWLTEPGE